MVDGTSCRIMLGCDPGTRSSKHIKIITKNKRFHNRIVIHVHLFSGINKIRLIDTGMNGNNERKGSNFPIHSNQKGELSCQRMHQNS